MCEVSYSYAKFTELLTKNGVTTAQVAKETGISESVFSNWKKRKDTQRNLTVGNLAKIAKYFGVPMETFIPEGGDS